MTFAAAPLRRNLEIASAPLAVLARERLAEQRGRPGKIGLSHQPESVAHDVRTRSFMDLFLVGCQRRRSASAALTSAGACSAPSTVSDSMVARARSGVTSSAMTARPSTRIFKPFARRLNGFQVLPGKGPQAQFKGEARSRLLRRIGMGRKLVADRRADEIRAIGIEAVAHQKIDRSEIDKAKIDSQLLAIGRLGQEGTSRQAYPSIQMLCGWYMDGGPLAVKAARRPCART